ncbi:hypothetical protein DFH09DRAFT_42117 [Mycena vulgaris]|nr:hypothetical protein DFH09DRAFT_42117 [Mycena vulgaris]
MQRLHPRPELHYLLRSANQHWTLALVPGSANPGLTQIISSACNTYLSYPGQGTPSLALRSQTTSRSSLFSSWHLIAVGSTGAFNIVEFSSGTYLTAWDQDLDPAVMSSGSPVSLLDSNLAWGGGGDSHYEPAHSGAGESQRHPSAVLVCSRVN